MLAIELISTVVLPLKASDTVQQALEKMREFKLYHLPIVSKNQFLGLISEDELLEIRDQQLQVGSISLSIFNAFVFEDTHIYDIIRVFNQLHLSILPVLDLNKNYLGAVSIPNLLASMADIYAAKEPGGIIVLSISNRDNSLAHIAQIVEADNAQILSSHVNSFPDSTRLEVTLKINRTELSGIIAAFERYNYEVKAIFNHNHSDNGNADRFNSFMNYLNV